MKVKVQTDKESMSYDELAWLFAEELTRIYSEYQGGLKDSHKRQDLRRYKLGQYKFMKNYLESIL